MAFLLLATLHSDTRAKSDPLAIADGLVNPDSWFETIKEKITLPLPNSSRINTSRPEHTLESATARVKELNEKIKTETGIDFAKLASWLGKLAKAIFKTAVDILHRIANVL